jgi:hypothetical protein
LDPEDIRGLSLRAIWNFFRRTGLSWLGPSEGAQRACQGLRAAGLQGLDSHVLILILVPVTLCALQASVVWFLGAGVTLS